MPLVYRMRTIASGVLPSLLALLLGTQAAALLPTSPRVKALVQAGLDQLEKMPFEGTNESKLGSKCLAGLALHKGGRPSSPRIKEAISACRQAASQAADLDNYSHGLAIIFLTEVAASRERVTVQSYLSAMAAKQMPHGGWGYPGGISGDTSQTQYTALAMWQAHKTGLRIAPEMAKQLIDWLNKTQDPSGTWGYHGKIAEGSELLNQAKSSRTLAAAALASLMIGADLHGLLGEGALTVAGDMSATGGDLPDAVKRVRDQVKSSEALNPKGVDWSRVSDALRMGERWMKGEPNRPPQRYPLYYWYALERYESFREARVGKFELEPTWYEEGIDYLEREQGSPGVWSGGCGKVADTAFAVLFMLRSTQKSLQRGIGEGALVSGRGLPKNLATATLRRGQVVVEMDAVGVGDFLAMMEKGEADRLDSLAADPSALVVGDMTAADTERLTQVLRSGSPAMRRLATRALGRGGELDSVPALLYAMTDPDRTVAREARDGLRFISRRPLGFNMPDDFSDDERYFALEQWQRWYKTLRPEAIIDLGR
ncbi:MAG: HEAT repeat domain-containing protein [Planctomycetota bacterium]